MTISELCDHDGGTATSGYVTSHEDCCWLWMFSNRLIIDYTTQLWDPSVISKISPLIGFLSSKFLQCGNKPVTIFNQIAYSPNCCSVLLCSTHLVNVVWTPFLHHLFCGFTWWEVLFYCWFYNLMLAFKFLLCWFVVYFTFSLFIWRIDLLDQNKKISALVLVLVLTNGLYYQKSAKSLSS